MFLGSYFRKYRALMAITAVHKVFAVSAIAERMLSSLKNEVGGISTGISIIKGNF